MTLITDPARAAAATPIVVVHIGNFDAFLADADAHTRAWRFGNRVSRASRTPTHCCPPQTAASARCW